MAQQPASIDGESYAKGDGPSGAGAGRPGRAVVVLAIAAVGAGATTLIEGVPRNLPPVALGSGVLLHAERTAALFWGLAILLLVFMRAARGEFPIELSSTGARYSEATTAERSDDATRLLAAHLTSETIRIDEIIDLLDAYDRRIARCERGFE